MRRDFERYLSTYKLLLIILLGIIIIWVLAGATAWRSLNKSITDREIAHQAELRQIEAEAGEFTAARDKKQKEEAEAAKKAEEAKKAKESEERSSQQVGSSQSGASAQAGSCNNSSKHNNPTSIDVLVNKKHCLVPLQFAPSDLVTTNGATISAKAANDFNRMFADAAKAGQPFSVTSSYRSYATQVSTYNYWVSISGQSEADTYSARPGFSEHQTGLVVDVAAGSCSLSCFGSTTQYKWFQQNATKYGFIQRYQKGYEHITGYVSEEWHYRYVGVAVAQDMESKGVKTLEQYWGLEGGDYR